MNLIRKTGFSLLISSLALGLLFGCKPKDGGEAVTVNNNNSTVLKGRELPTKDGNKMEGDTIKIGLIASLNGDNQPWGEDSRKGAALAVKEFNDAGGKDGHKVDLIVADTSSKPEGGKSATEKLVGENKVLAVVGEVSSGITLPAANVCQENGVPIVAIGATRVDVTENGGAVFRTCFTDNFQGAAIAKFAYEDLGRRKVAVMTDIKEPYSVGLSDIFKRAFIKLGGEIVDEQKYQKGDKDFKGQLTNLKAKNPDGLFCSGYFTEVGPIAKQRLVVGLNVPMFGGDGWDAPTLLESGGDAIVGSYFLNHYHKSEARPEVASFLTKFMAEYHTEPANAMGPLAYDAMSVVLDSIKRAPTMDSRAILKAISETKDFKGVSGSITIGPDGNAQKPAIMLKVEKDGFKAFKQIPFFKFEG